MCWWPQTSGYSYPRVATIRIDEHPTGETRPTHDMHPTLSPSMVPDHMYLTQLTHSNLSPIIDRVEQSHYFREKGIPDYITSTPTDQSVGPHLVSLLLSSKEVVEKAKHLSAAGY
jgi:hypothetical protein